MPWIESHTEIERHRKTILMAAELGIKRVHLSGHLHALWHQVLEQQENGNLSDWPNTLIAQMAEYDGDAEQFVELLKKYCWIDRETNLLHDWLDYAGKYLWRKYHTANPRRLKEIYKLHRSTYRLPKQQPKGYQKVTTRGLVGCSSSSSLNLKEEESLREETEWPSPEALVKLYNDSTPDECPAVETLSPARKDKAKKYLAAFPDEEFWRRVFKNIKGSPFLRGHAKSNGHHSFIADFDWLLTKGRDGSENCVKVAEGKYNNG